MNDDDDDATNLLIQYCALFPNSNLKQTVRRFPILHVVNSFGIIYASKKQTTSNYTLLRVVSLKAYTLSSTPSRTMDN